MTSDGRYVVFVSPSTNLMLGSPPGAGLQLWLWDRDAQAQSIPSTVPLPVVLPPPFSGQSPLFGSTSVAAGGNATCFTASTAGGPNSVSVFLLTGRGGQARAIANNSSLTSGCAISADGNVVSFATSDALLPTDTNGNWDVYSFNATTSTYTLISDGTTLDTLMENSLSSDGTTVAYVTSSPNRVHVHTINSGIEHIVGSGRMPSLSADGSFVAFTNYPDVYSANVATGAIAIQDVSAAGVIGNFGGDTARMSANGGFVTFRTVSTNFVSGDTNGALDLFITSRR